MNRMRRTILILSVIIILMTITIRMQEDAPVWFMLAAVFLAFLDGICVLIDTHHHDAYIRQLKKEKEEHL